MKKVFLIIVVALFDLVLVAQSDTILDKFNANVVGERVLLNWRIKAGNTCNGIEVYRSTDSLNYQLLGNVEGIYGNLSFPVDYEFFDQDPVPNSKNYYRLNLGGNGFSRVVSAWYFDLTKQDYILSPNPVLETGVLRFKNDAGLTVELRLFDQTGKLKFTHTTNSDNFILQSAPFDTGVYFFQLYSEDHQSVVINGKVVFVR